MHTIVFFSHIYTVCADCLTNSSADAFQSFRYLIFFHDTTYNIWDEGGEP